MAYSKFLNSTIVKASQQVGKGIQRHAGLDPASSLSSYFWIPASAGMT